jgi:hypothetical protein
MECGKKHFESFLSSVATNFMKDMLDRVDQYELHYVDWDCIIDQLQALKLAWKGKQFENLRSDRYEQLKRVLGEIMSNKGNSM